MHTVDPRFGKVGKQVCKDTGPLTKKRMETIDDLTLPTEPLDFIRAAKPGRQASLCLVERHAYAFPHPCRRQGSRHFGPGRIFGRAWCCMTGHVGQFLKKLDELGIADNGPTSPPTPITIG